MESPAIDLSQIRLREALFVECAVLNKEEDPLMAEQVYDCDFSYEVGHALMPEQSMVGLELRLRLDGLDKNRELNGVRGHFWLRFTFEVLNLAALLGDAAPPVVPPALYLTLLGIAYSTARGLVMAKIAATVLQGVTLPIVDVRELVRPANKDEVDNQNHQNNQK